MQISQFNPLYDSIKLIQNWYDVSEQELKKPVSHEVLKKLCKDTETLATFLKITANQKSNRTEQINLLTKNILKEINKHSIKDTEIFIKCIVKNTHSKLGKDEAFQPLHFY